MPSPHLQYDIVDVFTTEKYAGNPLAVVQVPSSLRQSLTQNVKQKIAREFNLSETVFLHDSEAEQEETVTTKRDVEIFTPIEELPLAGHPVIGTAWLVAASNTALETAIFNAKAGAISIAFSRVEEVVRVSAVMPHNIHVHSSSLSQYEFESLQPALRGLSPREGSGWPIVSLTKGVTFALIEVDSMETLGKASTFSRPANVKLDEGWTPSFLGLYFYFRESNGKIQARMIESEIGEDPVTGSASCGCSAYLAMETFKEESVKEWEFALTQGTHCGRTGSVLVGVTMRENGEVDKITLGGTAVRTMSGVLL